LHLISKHSAVELVIDVVVVVVVVLVVVVVVVDRWVLIGL